jgi:hypothetical protein
MIRVAPTKDLMGIWSPVLFSDGMLEKDDKTGIYSMFPLEECKCNCFTSTGLSLISGTVAYHHVLT